MTRNCQLQADERGKIHKSPESAESGESPEPVESADSDNSADSAESPKATESAESQFRFLEISKLVYEFSSCNYMQARTTL